MDFDKSAQALNDLEPSMPPSLCAQLKIIRKPNPAVEKNVINTPDTAEKKTKYETHPMVRRSSLYASDKTPKSAQRKIEVIRGKGIEPRKLEVVKMAKYPPTTDPKTPRNKILEVVAYTPKTSPKTPKSCRKVEGLNKSLKLEVYTPKSLRKKALTTPSATKKLSNKVKSPITKTIQNVTESLIKKNHFQSDTPSKAFKIYKSKNDEDIEELEKPLEKTIDDYPMLSPSPKKISRPRVELPTKYLGSNVSFEDDPYADEPMLSIEKRLAGIEGEGSFVKMRKKPTPKMSLKKLIKTLEGNLSN